MEGFLVKKIKGSLYRWPNIVDEQLINSKYVIFSGFDFSTTNGRVWSIICEQMIGHIYAQYKQTYFAV